MVGVRVKKGGDGGEWECRAVEVVPGGHDEAGPRFVVFLYQSEARQSATKVLAALASFGESFAAASDDFGSLEFADEVPAALRWGDGACERSGERLGCD